MIAVLLHYDLFILDPDTTACVYIRCCTLPRILFSEAHGAVGVIVALKY